MATLTFVPPIFANSQQLANLSSSKQVLIAGYTKSKTIVCVKCSGSCSNYNATSIPLLLKSNNLKFLEISSLGDFLRSAGELQHLLLESAMAIISIHSFYTPILIKSSFRSIQVSVFMKCYLKVQVFKCTWFSVESLIANPTKPKFYSRSKRSNTMLWYSNKTANPYWIGNGLSGIIPIIFVAMENWHEEHWNI